MRDRGLYERVLGLPEPWHVVDVELRDEAREVVVEVAMRSASVLACPEFTRWYAWAIRSRLEPIKKVARMLKAHLPNILTYVRHRITNAATEGINAKIQWIKATGRGFTNRQNFRTAILFHCGGLDLYPHNV